MTDSESKRTAYLRANMSLGERVEALEHHVDNLHEDKATVVWAEAVDDRAVELTRRVDALKHEQGDLARRVAEIELGLSASTPTGAHICPMDLARLRRIEEQLKAIRKALMWNGSVSAAAWLTDIDAALDSEPKR